MSITTYVLVMTLIGSTAQSGQAIQKVEGFKSMETCLTAGNAWLKQVFEQSKKAKADRPATAICLEVK